MRQTQQIVPLVPLDCLDEVALGVLKMKLDAGSGRRALDLAVPPGWVSAAMSPLSAWGLLTGRGGEGAGEGDDGADKGFRS